MNPTLHKMNPLALAGVIIGVLALAGGIAALVASWEPIPAVVAIIAGVAAILFGAHVLGRGLPADAIASDSIHSSPVRLEGRLDPALSRGLWIIKWLLAIPHVLVLIPLVVALLVVTVAAGFVILFTGRYPAALFRFSVGRVPLGLASWLLRLFGCGHRPLPAVHPRADRLPGDAGDRVPGATVERARAREMVASGAAALDHPGRPDRGALGSRLVRDFHSSGSWCSLPS